MDTESSLRIFISSVVIAVLATGSSLSIQRNHFAPPELPDAPKINREALDVRRGVELAARFWLVDSGGGNGDCSDRDRVNFCALGPGTVVGVVQFVSPWRDYRDEIVKPGTYTLRYAIQPHL